MRRTARITASLAAILSLSLSGVAAFATSRPVRPIAAPIPAVLLSWHGQPVYTWHAGHPINRGGYVMDGSAQLDDVHCVGSNREIGQCMAARRGWVGDQWACLDHRWGVIESGWSTTAAGAGGAYGIPQAEPGYKMAGPNYVEVPGGGYVGDWLTDPRIQIAWGLRYIAERYGAPCNTPWTGGY